jgi:outer membrane immunogenic protein
VRRLSIAVIVAVSVVGFVQFASATDLLVKAPALKATAVPAFDPWMGFYIGATAGYGWGQASTSIVPNAAEFGIGAGDPIYGPLPSGPRFDGFVGGGEIGYNFRAGNILAGLETDLSYAGLQGSSAATGVPFIGGTFNTTIDAKLEWFGTVRGRLGALPANDLLIYVTGGLAYGAARTTVTAVNLGGADVVSFIVCRVRQVGYRRGGRPEAA